MFTGIIKKVCPIVEVIKNDGVLKYSVDLGPEFTVDLMQGASVSIDGVCQTVVHVANHRAWFEAIQETLDKTTLKHLHAGYRVNVERSARFGDEIGGHVLSGHIFGTVDLKGIDQSNYQYILTLSCPKEWTKYLFPKGYVALDGASLTVVDVFEDGFTVHLIPETLKRTTLGKKQAGDSINIEFDSQTQAIVDTIMRMLPRMDYMSRSTSS